MSFKGRTNWREYETNVAINPTVISPRVARNPPATATVANPMLPMEEAAARMQSWCDQAGCHLWMDLESFVFRNGVELHPRPIAGLVSDFTRLPNFEKTLHYQFPGLMSGPGMSRKPDGEPSVRLYLDYRRFLGGGAEASARAPK